LQADEVLIFIPYGLQSLPPPCSSPYSPVILNAEVTVSVPTTMSVNEEDGMVQVCASLSAVNDTERNFTITLATGDGTGMAKLV
jgi:hypothetical protein